MSRIHDTAPLGGDGPNRGEDLGGDGISSASAEFLGDEGGVEQEGRAEAGGLQDDDAPQAAE